MQQIEHRRRVDIDPDFGEHEGQRHGVGARGLDRADRGLVVERGKARGGGKFGPVRRAQPGDAAALLVDQDREISSAREVAQVVGEGAKLGRVLDVAREQAETGRVGVADQAAFGVGEGGAAEAEEGGEHAGIMRRPSSSFQRKLESPCLLLPLKGGSEIPASAGMTPPLSSLH